MTPQSEVRSLSLRPGRKLRGTLLLALAALTTLAGCSTVKPFSGEPVDLAVEHMLHAVAEAAQLSASRSEGLPDLELSQITLTLTTVAQRSTTGDFTLWVVTFDATRERDLTQSVSVVLKPPKTDPKSKKSEDDITSPHKSLVKGLAKGFDAAHLAARGAQEGLQRSHKGDKPLETSAISVTINFTVTGSATATPTVEIFGIDLTGSHTRSRENVHQVVMVFTDKSSDKKTSDDKKSSDKKTS